MDDPSLVTVRSLVGAAQVELAATCLGSLLAAVRRPVRLALHDDGTLGAAAREELSMRLGPACTFVDRAEATELVRESLRDHPRCQRFRDGHLFGPKLFDVPILAGRTRAVYADADILWTRPCDCPAYFDGAGMPAGSFVVMRDLKESYAVSMRKWLLLRRQGVRLTSRFCAGMMAFDPTGAGYDLDYIEWLLGADERLGLLDGFRFWAEQTIYAALAARAGGCAWIEPAECVVAHRRTFAKQRAAAVIHFAGFSRDLLAGRRREIDLAAFPMNKPKILSMKPAPVCGLGRRLLSAVRTRVLLSEAAPPAIKATPFGLTPMFEPLPKKRAEGKAP